MKHWVHNELKILGSASAITECLDFVKGDDPNAVDAALDFRKVIELGRMSAIGDYRCPKRALPLGTKEIVFDVTSSGATTSFKTHRVAPWMAICDLSRRFPSLVFVFSATEQCSGRRSVTACAKGKSLVGMNLNVKVEVELEGLVERDVDFRVEEAWRALKAAVTKIARQIERQNQPDTLPFPSNGAQS
jgi:hypothetical protein